MNLFREPRILYIAPDGFPDYQCDALLHGLKSLLGDRVVDAFPAWYLYKPTARNAGEFGKLYGKGFTLYGLLDFDATIDRSDIVGKIRARYFDLIIYGAIHRSQQFLFEVLSNYPEERICFIDGEDETRLFPFVVGRGRYFKRELTESHAGLRTELGILPIGFGIPREKIVSAIPAKTRVMAHIDPRDRKTYIYDSEADYYQGYRQSCFGITTKKAGWDTLRHYEILANGCMPLFLDLPEMPSTVMTHYPKLQMLWAFEYLAAESTKGAKLPNDEYQFQLGAALETFRQQCTTEAVAQYLLSVCER